MATPLQELRQDLYSLGQFDFTSETVQYDYKELNYSVLRDIYWGLENTQMQYGALLAPVIVDTYTAFEMGELPHIQVLDRANMTELEDETAFVNQFLKDQHHNLLEATQSKNLHGNTYIAFNLDRNLEAIPPDMVDPGFSAFSSLLQNAKVVQNRFMRAPKSGQKAKINVVREYTAEAITYSVKTESRAQGLDLPKVPTSFANPIGVCPVVLLPNQKKAGYSFGVSDFYSCIPLFLLFHRTLMRGFESQQYSGKPILVISGIEGPVSNWMADTFQIDTTQLGSANTATSIIEFFKRHKMLCLSGAVKVEYVESKVPTGKTAEIMTLVTNHMSRLSGIPEFMFGAAIAADTATAREQYTLLKAKIDLKRAQMSPVLIHLCKMAMVWYSKVSKNEETGEALETYGIVNKFEDTNKFAFDITWPKFLGGDERIRLEALTLLTQSNAISREGLLGALRSIYPSNAQTELNRIEDETARFAPPEIDPITGATVPKDTQSTKNADERKRKAGKRGGSAGSNPDASKTGNPTNNQKR